MTNTSLSDIGEAVMTSDLVTFYELFNTTTSIDDTPPQLTSYIELDIHHAIRLYYQCFISLTGFVANILALIVTLSRRMRKHSTCLYMSAIGGSDALTLVIAFVWWVSRYVNTTSVWSCKLIIFTFYYAIHFSVTLLVAMTTERYVAIRFPFWAHVHLTRRKSVYVIIVVAMAILALDAPNLATRTMITNEVTGSTRCLFSGSATLDMPYGFFLLYVWQWLDAGVYSFFPLTMLAIFNVLIIRTVRQRAATMRNMADDGDKKPVEASVTRSATEQQITVMLLVVTFAFIALTTPIAVTLILEKTWTPPTDPHGSAIWRLWRTVVSNLMYTNHAINFLLYSLSSQKFRREVVRLLPCCTVAPKGLKRSASSKMSRSSTSASVSHTEVTVSVDTHM